MGACELCAGRGWQVAPDGGAGSARPCRCRSASRPLRERLAEAGVWEAYLDCSRASWRDDWAPWPAAKLRPFPAQCPLVTIFGPTGSGKTHLATAILAEHLERGGLGLWREVSSALRRLQAAMGTREAEALWDELIDPRHLLVLDALYSQRSTDWSDAEVSRVLRYRHGRRLPTVVTIDLPGLIELDEVEPGLSSRCGGAIVIGLAGEDRRTARGGG
jgi:chromosomal replication initiation ATPase DnaA